MAQSAQLQAIIKAQENLSDQLDDITTAMKSMSGAAKSAQSSLSGMASASSAASSAAKKTAVSMQAARRSATQFNSAIGNLKTRTVAASNGVLTFGKKTRKANKSVKRTTGNIAGMTGGLANMAKSFAAFSAVAGVFFGIQQAISAVVRETIRLEKQKVAFKTLFDAASKGLEKFRQVSEFAGRTPFTIQGVRDAAKKLKAFGVQADNIIPTLSTLGNISAGTGADLKRLIVSLGQVKAQGELTGRELREFQKKGIALDRVLADQLGKSVSKVNDLISEGEIKYRDVAKALESATKKGGRFHEIMKKQASTLGGAIQNLKDQFTLLAGEIGSAASDSLTPIIKVAAEQLSNFREDIRLTTSDSEKLKRQTDKLSQSAVNAAAVWVSLTNAFSLVGNGLQLLVSAFKIGVPAIGSALMAVIKTAGTAFGKWIGNMVEKSKTGFKSIKQAIKFNFGKANKLADKAQNKDIVPDFGKIFKNKFGQEMNKHSKELDETMKNLAHNTKEFKQSWDATFSPIKRAKNLLKDFEPEGGGGINLGPPDKDKDDKKSGSKEVKQNTKEINKHLKESKKTYSEFRKAANEALLELKADHKKNIKDVNEEINSLQTELKNTKREYNDQLEDLRTSHSRTMSRLARDMDRVKRKRQELRAEFSRKLQQAETNIARKVAEERQKIKELRRELRRAEDAQKIFDIKQEIKRRKKALSDIQGFRKKHQDAIKKAKKRANKSEIKQEIQAFKKKKKNIKRERDKRLAKVNREIQAVKRKRRIEKQDFRERLNEIKQERKRKIKSIKKELNDARNRKKKIKKFFKERKKFIIKQAKKASNFRMKRTNMVKNNTVSALKTEIGWYEKLEDSIKDAQRAKSSSTFGGGPTTPDIPGLAEGGIVTSPTLSFVGEEGSEAVIPLDKLDQFGGGGSGVTVNVSGVFTNETAARELGDQIIDRFKRERRV